MPTLRKLYLLFKLSNVSNLLFLRNYNFYLEMPNLVICLENENNIAFRFHKSFETIKKPLAVFDSNKYKQNK